MNRKKCFLILASFALVFAYILLQPNFAKALVVSNPVMELSADPGQTISKKVLLENETNQDVTFYSSIYNFKSNDVNGEPILDLAPKQGGIDLASWIQVEVGPITLKPKESKEENIVISVPQNADPGGHYAAVLWGSEPQDASNSSQVSVGWKMGHLILLRVSGNIIEKAQIQNFNTDGGLRSALPVTFLFAVKNDGNVHVKPTGTITIRNIFGTQSANIPVNVKGGNVLPSSTRSFSDDVWVKDKNSSGTNGLLSGITNEIANFGFGRYTAEANIYYGESQTNAKEYASFWVIPWRLILLLIVVLIFLRFAIKRYNAHIIKKAGSIMPKTPIKKKK